jgi:hypothetical protein
MFHFGLHLGFFQSRIGMNHYGKLQF